MNTLFRNRPIASALLTLLAAGCVDASVGTSSQPLAAGPELADRVLAGTPLFDGMAIDATLAEAFAGESVDDFGECETEEGRECMWWEIGNVVTVIRDTTCTSGALCVDGYELHAVVTQTSWRTRSWHYANDVVEVNEEGSLEPRGEIRLRFNRSAGLTVQHFDPDGAPLGPPVSGPMPLSSQDCEKRYCSRDHREEAPANVMCVTLEALDHIEREVRSFVRGRRVEIDHPTPSGACRELDDTVREYLEVVGGGVRAGCAALCDEMFTPLAPGEYVWDSNTGTYVPRTAAHGDRDGIIVFGGGGGNGGAGNIHNPHGDLEIGPSKGPGTHGDGDRDRDSGTPGGTNGDGDDGGDGDGDDDDDGDDGDKDPEDEGPPILSFF